MNISQHAKQRMKERCGYNKKTQDRMAQKAFENGITHGQTKGNLNKWITSLYFKNKNANNIKLYGEQAYIFCDETLVTVIPVPVNLKKNLRSMIRERRNSRIYEGKRKKTYKCGKKERARFKKEMQKKGIIPPDKPKLNRKKYVEKAKKEWDERDNNCYIWDIYLMRAVYIMLGARDKNLRVTQEAVGAAKILKLAIRLKEFGDMLEAEKRSTYTIGEWHDYIKDILDA